MRSVRLFFLVVLELARKYTRSLILGFIAGLGLSLLFWRIYPYAIRYVIKPVERIGLVGVYNPSTLPPLVQKLISDGLTNLTEDGTPVPALALEWEATNSGKTFIFTLRDDAYWHNGSKVNAHDINYNIRGVTFIPTGEYTLTAYLQYPYSALPTLLSKPVFTSGLRGVGRYTVGKIQLSGGTMKSLILVPTKNERESAKQFTFYQTEALAATAFKLGEIDELMDVSTASAFSSWGNAQVSEFTNYHRIITIFFNMKNQRFQDKNVRQGLAFAIPNLPYEKAGSPISKYSWAYAKNYKNFIYNPTETRRLLKNTEFASPSAQVRLSTFPAYLDTAQAIASSWEQFGIVTNIQVENSVPQDYEILLSGTDIPPDPDQYPFWHSTQTGTNISGYSNVKIDKLLEDGRSELDHNKRKAIYADFQRRLVEDAPAVFLYYPKFYSIKRGK